MVKRRFSFPWEKKYRITCPKCGGTIETRPLWSWEKNKDDLDRLQIWFCHKLDPEFLKRIPVLSQNDWESKQKLDAMRKELGDDEKKKRLLEIEDGLPKIFSKYGVFALYPVFTEKTLEMLFLFLGRPEKLLSQLFFVIVMGISRTYVSTILKRLRTWGLVEAWKAGETVIGRARGRKLWYKLADNARLILEEDMQKYNFFRDAVAETVTQAAEEFPEYF